MSPLGAALLTLIAWVTGYICGRLHGEGGSR